jgi:hypothetical protein
MRAPAIDGVSMMAAANGGCAKSHRSVLLTNALAQPLELRSYMLAAEFFLEPGDRLYGRIFPQTCQTLCVPRT